MTLARFGTASALLLAATGCMMQVGEEEQPEVGLLEQQAVFATDNRTSMNAADLAAHPAHNAIGLVAVGGGPGNPHGGWCTGTRISGNYVLTAAHCLLDVTDPTIVRFFPAHIHSDADPDDTKAPVVNVRRIIRGTGVRDALNHMVYEGGSDWAILMVDAPSYTNATAAFPTWASYPTISTATLTSTSPSNVTVTAIGYSKDYLAWHNTAGIHANCSIKKNHPSATGVYLSDCDTARGASGGPVLLGQPERIVALIGGEAPGGPFPAYSDNVANTFTNAKGLAWAPINPTGIAAALDSAGKAHVYAADFAFANQIDHAAQTQATGLFAPWADFRTTTKVPDPRRMSATTGDSHQFVFAVDENSGRVYENHESVAAGAWNGWGLFWGADSQTANTLDVASTSTTQVPVFQFLMRADGTVFLKRRVNGWNGVWTAWKNLSASLGSGVTARAIGAGQIGGYPQIVVATSNGVLTNWATDTAGTQWVGWNDFADTMPPGVKPIDVEVGYTYDGRLSVYLLSNELGTRIWRRTKVSSVPGSAWGAWTLHRDSRSTPELGGASQLTLLPYAAFANPSAIGDTLLILVDGNLLLSSWTSNGWFNGFLPFYGNAN